MKGKLNTMNSVTSCNDCSIKKGGNREKERSEVLKEAIGEKAYNEAYEYFLLCLEDNNRESFNRYAGKEKLTDERAHDAMTDIVTESIYWHNNIEDIKTPDVLSELQARNALSLIDAKRDLKREQLRYESAVKQNHFITQFIKIISK